MTAPCRCLSDTTEKTCDSSKAQVHNTGLMKRRRKPERRATASIHTRFANVLRNAPMMVWMAADDGAVTYVNRKWLAFTGHRARDEFGDKWLEAVHPDDRHRVVSEYRFAVKHQAPFALEYRMRRADDVYRDLCHYGLPLHEADGTFAGFVGTCVDVTPSRGGTVELEQTMERLRLVAKEEEEARTSRHRLRDLSAHLEAAREEERRQLARALHDEVGQLLTGVRLEIAAAVQQFRETRRPAEFAVVDRLQSAVGLVDLSVATLQRIAIALRPPLLDQIGLTSAIRWEAAVFERRTGIRCRVSSNPPQIEARGYATILYRILLEALANIARHAQAGTVWIRIRERSGRLTLQVRDNGRGISDEDATNPTTLGLLGMRERALAVGGEVTISRHPAGGTKVVVVLPPPPQSTHPTPAP